MPRSYGGDEYNWRDVAKEKARLGSPLRWYEKIYVWWNTTTRHVRTVYSRYWRRYLKHDEPENPPLGISGRTRVDPTLLHQPPEDPTEET